MHEASESWGKAQPAAHIEPRTLTSKKLPILGHRPVAWLALSWRWMRLPLVAYLGVMLLMMIFEESLIFFPAKYPEGDWSDPGPHAEDVFFEASDGTRLHGRLAQPTSSDAEPLAVILYAHGNAGNLTHRQPIMDRLTQLGCTVLMFDYRGYGKSEGRPSESGVLKDARAARAWLAERTGRAEDELVLMGRSVGGAVAVDLAQDGARGLILESTFTSLPDVAGGHYPWLPVRLLMRTRFASIKKIPAYKGPLLQSHGDRDQIVPTQFGRRLFEAAGSDKKRWLNIPGAGHNSMLPESYYRELREFLAEL